MKSLNVLIVATSHKVNDNLNTDGGVWLQEIADPYYIFKDRGERVTICSPEGGHIHINAQSEIEATMPETARRFKKDDTAMYHLHHSLPIKEIHEEDYDLVLIAGGHGCMHDLVNNVKLNGLLQHFIAVDKPIGAIGSGVVALLSLKNEEGYDFIKDKRVTAYSNEEVVLEGVEHEVPFLLESRLLQQGAHYSKADPGEPHVIIAGNLITAQNPSSSADMAKTLLSLARSPEILYDSIY